MPKMRYLNNKLSKIAKRWGQRFPSSPLPSILWPEVAWFAQIVIFQTNYNEIELEKAEAVMTSFQLRHRYYVTKITSQDLSLGSFQSNFQ